MKEMIYMKNKYIFKIFLIVLIVTIASYSYNQLTLNKSDMMNKKVKQNMNEDVKDNKKDIVTDKKEGILVYNILGKSNKLTDSQWNSMQHWRSNAVKLANENKDEVYINGYNNEKMVALTFDDGPDYTITPKIGEVLKENNVKGNFFFIGEQVAEKSNIVKKIYEDGNLVLSHSYNHIELNKLSEEEIKKQVTMGEKEIFKVIGKRPKFIRPPYGAIDNKVINILEQNEEKIILWSIDTLDWSQKDERNIVKNIMENLRPGEIVLMHSNEDKEITLKALPNIIKTIKEKGYKIVTLDKLLKTEAYK
ncbi:peptidoglycan/xylan/chitin deacetylase (PgdA/CDA1 family) [Clostridium tetanomorphum]|nr:peptidoglycan/xylan/chitin deacetylase (PgdA/CDA1 family) [Clostridium tetanomorphum]